MIGVYQQPRRENSCFSDACTYCRMVPSSMNKKISQTSATGKKVTMSFVIRDVVEKQHRSGINAMQFDANANKLYTAGRDSTIRSWNCNNQSDPYMQSLEHHTDWVNDIVLCCNGRNLISAGSDTMVKVWNAPKGFCMSTLRTHKDYVRALAYSPETEKVASAGLDKAIYLWDVQTLTALTATNNTITTSSLVGSKNSIYSLATNTAGTIIVSGSTEKVLRVWDPRLCTKQMKLIGHSDNVKALAINAEGTQILSGSSDGTVKLWSVGQQQCILTFRMHKEGVWALAANESFTRFVSAGRDQLVFKTDLRSTESRVIVEETNPVLCVCPNPDFSGIWVGTEESDVKFWSTTVEDVEEEESGNNASHSEPVMVIKGAPAIKRYHVLNDKRHVLTQDSAKNVCLYDVLKMTKIEDLGEVDFDRQVKKRFKMTHIPAWFSVDLKTGFLGITLAQDENDAFSAWLPAKEIGCEETPDLKINYGYMVIKSLLQHWNYNLDSDNILETKEQTSSSQATMPLLTIPQHIPIVFSEAGNKTLYRVTVDDCKGQTETQILHETVPEWIKEVLIQQRLPKFIKIAFYLLPPNEYMNKNTKRERLIANDFIQVHKIAEHVYEKFCMPYNSPTGSASSTISIQNQSHNDQALFESVKIYCNDQVLDEHLDLRTVKHHVWKSSGDLTLYFRANKYNSNFLQKN